MALDFEMMKKHYETLEGRINVVRANFDKPLSLAEKILYTHLDADSELKEYGRGKDYVCFRPDRVAMQDTDAQMALLQFMRSGRDRVAVPSTVHCTFLTQANLDAEEGLGVASNFGKEVMDFLQSASYKYGLGFWNPGAGIIYQVVLENYAFPGGMILGTYSHTPTAGGLGMVAFGGGSADALDVMADIPWELKMPTLIGIKLNGKLTDSSLLKGVVYKVADLISANGGTEAIVEYFGEGATRLSCTSKGTICTMGANAGALTSIFGYDESMRKYLRDTGRREIADLADQVKMHLTGDEEVYADPQTYFDQFIEIDVASLEQVENGKQLD